jgi:hypothetical protein
MAFALWTMVAKPIAIRARQRYLRRIASYAAFAY